LFFHSPITPLRLTFLRTLLSYLHQKNSEAENRSEYERSFEKEFLDAVTFNFKRLEKMGATTLYLSNIAGRREGTKEAVSLDGRECDISVIENREGEFVMIRQIEEGGYKGGDYYSEG